MAAAGCLCECRSRGQRRGPQGGAAGGLGDQGAGSAAPGPGLASEPTSAPPQVCSGLGTERAGGLTDTPGFSGITLLQRAQTPPSSPPGTAQLFPSGLPKPCLFFLLSLPGPPTSPGSGSSYFSQVCSLPLSQPHSSCLSLLPAAGPLHCLSPPPADPGSRVRLQRNFFSPISSDCWAPGCSLATFKSDWQRIPTPVYHRAKRKIRRPGAGWRNPAPPRTALVEWAQASPHSMSGCRR